MTKITTVSLNVRGLNNDKKCRKIHRWLHNNNAKIVLLQETFCKTKNNSLEHKDWDIYHNFTNSSHSRGVAIMVHKCLDAKIVSIHRKDDARVILINLEIDGVQLSICNIYAPSDEYIRRDYFNNLKFWIARHTENENELLLGGDFNCAINDDDRKNIRGNRDVSRTALKNLLKSLNLMDAWYIHNSLPHFTFTDPGNGSQSRIDYFFISETKNYKIKNTFLKYVPIPDHHSAVFLVYKINENKKGKGYWKFNAKLLKIPELRPLIIQIANECRRNYPDLNSRTKWELFKIKVQEACIKLGVIWAKKKKECFEILQCEIDILNKNESEGNPIDTVHRDKLIKNLNNLYKEKDDGYLIRSKIKWVEEGEKSTKFFFNLEKSRQSNNVIRQIKDKNNVLQTEDSEILKATSEFYKNLFTSRNIDPVKINKYLDETNFENKLTEKQKQECDNEISEEEFNKVIKNLKNEKSPGCDGLTPEFYKAFWIDIKDIYIEMIKETFVHGELPYTLRKAILALLFKKGDTTLLKNYRPISLTNYDYKILCFVLANRLQNVLKDIILDDQTGYIKGRYIGTNARLLQDYFDHCESKQIPGILLYLDFEKAFDSIEWPFMMGVLKKFNFGNNFMKWVNILYTNPIISIKNNGWMSTDIDLFRGVRQGCPLSALLFVLTVEVMAIRIRNNDNIQGFQCSDKNVKHSMYADDTTLLLSNLESLRNAIETVNNFSQVAGPKLNVEKTEGILLGPLKDTLIEYMGIKFTNNAVRCLGIYMGHDQIGCKRQNWLDKLDKMKIVFERWKNRHLTIFGKILIIKSLAISKFIHTMSIICTPEDVLKEIEKAIFKFLWDSNDRIKRNTLIGPKNLGGIKMLDIYSKDKALKIGWIKRLSTDSLNNKFIQMCLSKHGINVDYLMKCSSNDPKLFMNKLGLPEFWANVFAYFNECKTVKSIEVLNVSEFLSEPIWLNTRFNINKNPIFISNWTKSGILYVKDIFCNNTLITENLLLQKLTCHINWIAEYSKIKKIFKPFLTKFNFRNAQFINIKNRWNILVNNKIYNTKVQKSTFYYDILIKKKFQKNYMENTWMELFNIQEINWENVYKYQVWELTDKKLGEFNYKLLCNIVATRSKIVKWNRNINENCTYCNVKQTVKHLLYDCTRVNNIWAIISRILKLDISYKHIILGNRVDNDTIKYRNMLISYIKYSLYKFWLLAENKKIDFKNDCLLKFIKKDLFFRTTYVRDQRFIEMCDKITNEL